MIKSQDEVLKILFLSTVAVIVIGGYMFWKQKNNKRKARASQIPIPTKWRQIGEVSKINLYPLKSGKHKSLDSAICTEVGLMEEETTGKHSLSDRSFVLFDETTNDRLTIRTHSQMLHIQVKSLGEDKVAFSSPGSDDLVIKLPTKNENNKINFVILWFKEKVFTVDCGEEASAWFTKILISKENGRCRLGYYARDMLPARSINKSYWSKFVKAYNKMDDDYMGSYSDLASYMVMTQASLDDINSLLDDHVTMYNFRPNILVKGTKEPFEEDKWDWLKIGDDIVLRSFKYCTRCTITTVDPETGVRRPDLEPLKSLRIYRFVRDPEKKKLEGDSPVMGVYMGLHKTGVIKTGAPVYVNCD